MSQIEYEEDEYDPWEEIGICYGGYSSLIDAQIIGVLEHIFNHDGNKPAIQIDAELELSDSHIELIKYILCSAYPEIIEYGTSPRVCFMIDKDKGREILEKWKSYYANKWLCKKR